MKLLKGLLLGSAAALASVATAQAADLPVRQAAPIEYVRICDAYGAGFFFIPGTETCLKVGGLGLTQVRSYDAGYSIAGSAFQGNGSAAFGTTNPLSLAGGAAATLRAGGGGPSTLGFVPTGSQYSNARQRDNYGWDTLGRIELDSRSATPWGTLRAFLRVDAYVGTGYSNTGALNTGTSYNSNPYNGSAGVGAVRETTYVNKAFIQFAGLTAGRAQSMFDFYANAYNYQRLGGSAATTQLLAYTYTFGNGLSGTISIEDKSARQTFIGSTIATTSAAGITMGGINSTSFVGTPGGMRFPDIVGNIRVDQPWGSAQLSAAGHQVNASLFPTTALATAGTTYAFPAATSNGYGWAIQGGIQLNADYLSPGDKLWLQAAYEKGAFNYVYGDNFATSYGAWSGNRFYGSAYTPADTSAGWNPNVGSDCVFTLSGACEQQSGWGVTAAYKHYWIPTLASAVYGSYLQINYSNNALAGFGGAVGVSNLKTGRVGTNLVWTPIKGFDIGAEFMYVNVTTSRPAGLAPDAVLKSVGLPGYKGSENEYEGRIRVQRAF